MTYRIAVTGVGGGAGQGILKALSSAPLLADLFAVDVQPKSAGFLMPGVTPVVLPKPEHDLSAWVNWIVEEDIDLIIPGSDYDLIPLASVAGLWRKRALCKVAVSSPKMITIANDKFLTAQHLLSCDLDAPASEVDGHRLNYMPLQHGYPIVVKPRNGAASRGFQVCKTAEEIRFYWNRVDNPIAQEYLEGEEYTASIFFTVEHVPVAQFILKRQLKAGHTAYAETVYSERLNAWLGELAAGLSRLGPVGPINVQFRDVPNRGPVCFELNARCSGTTAIRAHFGYNDPLMLVRHLLDMQDIHQPVTSSGCAWRVLDELYKDSDDENVKGVSHDGQAAD